MVEIIGVRFSNAGKIYYFDPQGQTPAMGEQVIVETARGLEVGRVALTNKMVEDHEITPPLKTIVRLATKEDIQILEENKAKEKEAFEVASKKIAEHNLEMKLIDVEYTFDRSKILFYFTADGRIDFRDLVKSLAGIFRTRIELRQIGVRDEARQLGSYGICGRFLCCSSFLDDFKPVSIKMAKEQGLSLNPTKISGVCGRLMCCLQYEQNAYDDMLKKMPTKGMTVETDDGVGIVVDTSTLKGQIKVRFTDGDTFKVEPYKLGEFKILKNVKLEPIPKRRNDRDKPKKEKNEKVDKGGQDKTDRPEKPNRQEQVENEYAPKKRRPDKKKRPDPQKTESTETPPVQQEQE